MIRRGAVIAGVVFIAIGAACWMWPGASLDRLSCLKALSPGQHPGMVWVPGGTFQMGDNVYDEEGPIRSVTVDGFWMDETEITNAQFTEFVQATGYVTVAERPAMDGQPGAAVFVMPETVTDLQNIAQWWRYVPGANWRHPGGPATSISSRGSFPVTALAYEDLAAYAKWKGRSLPSEEQWEWAARGGDPHTTVVHDQPPEANTWQGVFPVYNSGEDGFAGVAPVGCYKPNHLGLYDMIGNVWEWTSGQYQDPAPGPKKRVIKGGSFLCARNFCMRYRAGARQGQEEDLGTSHLGFRTILLAPGP